MSLIETQIKQTWTKTRKFRLILFVTLITTSVLFLFWLISDLIFIKSGFIFLEDKYYFNNKNSYYASKVFAYLYLFSTIANIFGIISYFVFRSFQWKKDKKKIIYEGIVQISLLIIVIIFVCISFNLLTSNKWIIGPENLSSATSSQIIIYNINFSRYMSIIFVSYTIIAIMLFQANKSFELVNIYFDISLITAIFAFIAVPFYIIGVSLLFVYPQTETINSFWLHIDGQIIYSLFCTVLFVVAVLIGVELVLLIRINNWRIKRTKKSITCTAIFFSINIVMFIVCRLFKWSIREIYFNENWVKQIILLSIADLFVICSGWYSATRYINLYAKPSRDLKKEKMILD